MAKRKHGERVQDRFVFRDTDHIGSVDAAADAPYLRECFVDTGLVETLLDFTDHRQLIIGRTGSGKTAILEHVGTQDRDFSVLPVPAESLALNHIANSTILTFVRQLGVNLDIFYKLLWRHVFAIEILKAHFNITDETRKRSFIQKLGDLFKKPNHRRAIEYLEQWGGGKFWLDTNDRIVEITRGLETELRNTLQSDSPINLADASWISSLSEAQRTGLAQRAQAVVNNVRMQELAWIIDLINERLQDSGDYYIVLIDRLDDGWVEDGIRYLLIRSLVETIRDFLRVSSRVKILVAIRQDLIERVFEKTRDKHFQEEKYRNLFVDIRWSPDQLRNLVDKRIGKLVRGKYEKLSAKFTDLFPKKIGDQDAFEYIVNRTLLRPRDVIHFVNLCIHRAANTPMVTKAMLLDAEADYSKDRLNFLYDEWRADYPDLKRFVALLKNRQIVVGLSEMTDPELEAVAVELSGSDEISNLGRLAVEAVEKGTSSDPVRVEMALVLYRVGLIGLKPATYEKVQWRSSGGRVSRDDVSKSSKMYIHPMAWRSLGCHGEM